MGVMMQPRSIGGVIISVLNSKPWYDFKNGGWFVGFFVWAILYAIYQDHPWLSGLFSGIIVGCLCSHYSRKPCPTCGEPP
jgi:hypothetical protein